MQQAKRGLELHFANDVIARVGDVETSALVERETLRTVEFGESGVAAVALESADIVAGDIRDVAVGGNLANTTVHRVRNVEVSSGVHGDTDGIGDGGLGCRTAIAAGARGAASGDRADGASADFPHDVVALIDDVKIIGGTAEGDARWSAELSRSGGAGISSVARSAGAGVQLLAKEGGYAQLRMPSGEIRNVDVRCRATVGEVGNAEQSNINWGKAGRMRWKGKRPTVRGVVMNPVDHPHGGGEGKTSGGRHPVSPWGKPEGRTRKRKASDSQIIRRRKSGKGRK